MYLPIPDFLLGNQLKSLPVLPCSEYWWLLVRGYFQLNSHCLLEVNGSNLIDNSWTLQDPEGDLLWIPWGRSTLICRCLLQFVESVNRQYFQDHTGRYWQNPNEILYHTGFVSKLSVMNAKLLGIFFFFSLLTVYLERVCTSGRNRKRINVQQDPTTSTKPWRTQTPQPWDDLSPNLTLNKLSHPGSPGNVLIIPDGDWKWEIT